MVGWHSVGGCWCGATRATGCRACSLEAGIAYKVLLPVMRRLAGKGFGVLKLLKLHEEKVLENDEGGREVRGHREEQPRLHDGHEAQPGHEAAGLFACCCCIHRGVVLGPRPSGLGMDGGHGAAWLLACCIHRCVVGPSRSWLWMDGGHVACCTMSLIGNRVLGQSLATALPHFVARGLIVNVYNCFEAQTLLKKSRVARGSYGSNGPDARSVEPRGGVSCVSMLQTELTIVLEALTSDEGLPQVSPSPPPTPPELRPPGSTASGK